jgi:hypothetical protein
MKFGITSKPSDVNGFTGRDFQNRLHRNEEPTVYLADIRAL